MLTVSRSSVQGAWSSSSRVQGELQLQALGSAETQRPSGPFPSSFSQPE